MDGDALSLASAPSLSASTAEDRMDGADMSEEAWSQGSAPEAPETPVAPVAPVAPEAHRLLSSEEQVTLITDSMTVTSTDQEKLQLLNKNTELRRINKELMKLNEEWDQVYRSMTLSLQQRVEALELENSAIKTYNSKLLLKAEHQQGVKDYYEHALMLEVKRNQELQEHIRHMESRLPPSDPPSEQSAPSTQGNFMTVSSSTAPPRGPRLSPTLIPAAPGPRAELGGPRAELGGPQAELGGPCSSAQGEELQEVQDLKEQLQAMQCQTQIYEAEFQTEHNSHKNTLQENRRLRKKREELRQQVALLQEQLRVYEDDFKRERSDKLLLQRLLKKTQPPPTDPVLTHRCSNARRPAEGDKRTRHEEQPQKNHHPLCPKHQPRP
ncbi:uncharacterized protein si:ch211-153b23.7 isoform X2 [Periophthalmus magnuspinnatus]|uniref:uncharacterized protein si:ch211-153b23.7 isoform X2 n=1 Tax=Periophthalmus magnuspinnatus TaxID=409849 RepID=UPI002436FC64|nr:uncharacterized protein si:ch211-153b23.7 isoform X2 [Periophthalmus magnuspinnatus]